HSVQATAPSKVELGIRNTHREDATFSQQLMRNVCSGSDIGKLLECVPDRDCIVAFGRWHFIERAGGDVKSLPGAKICRASVHVDSSERQTRIASGGEKAAHAFRLLLDGFAIRHLDSFAAAADGTPAQFVCRLPERARSNRLGHLLSGMR